MASSHSKIRKENLCHHHDEKKHGMIRSHDGYMIKGRTSHPLIKGSNLEKCSNRETMELINVQ